MVIDVTRLLPQAQSYRYRSIREGLVFSVCNVHVLKYAKGGRMQASTRFVARIAAVLCNHFRHQILYYEVSLSKLSGPPDRIDIISGYLYNQSVQDPDCGVLCDVVIYYVSLRHGSLMWEQH